MTNQTRRTALKFMGSALAAAATLSIPFKAAAKAMPWAPSKMDAMTAIFTRRSIRSFTSAPVTDEQVNTLLRAGMQAPSAGNEQPWEFIVIRDKETLTQAGKINKYAGFAKAAPVSILVCGNMKHDKFGGYWIEDVSAASQNILLAAHATGLGAVWTGIYPHDDRVDAFRELVGAPEHIVPMALIVLGHPRKTKAPSNRFKADRVHTERW